MRISFASSLGFLGLVLCSTGALAAPEDAASLQKQLEEMRGQFVKLRQEYDTKIKEIDGKIQELSAQVEKHEHELRLAREIRALVGPEAAEKGEGKGLGGLVAMAPVTLRAPSIPPGQAAPMSVTQPMGSLQQLMDFSVVANTMGSFVKGETPRTTEHVTDKFSLPEVELGFQAMVDPYGRADIFVAKHEGEDVEVEEGYFTWLTMPYNIQPKVGKFLAGVGKMNTVHHHERPQVTSPIVLNNFFGHEGLSGTGASVSWLVPNKWDKFIEVTAQVMNTDNDSAFAGEESRDKVYVARARATHDLSDDSSLEFGLSAALGKNSVENHNRRTTIEGLDITYKWKPRNRPYKSFLWQTEFLFSQREDSGRIADEPEEFVPQRDRSTWGFYSFMEYQLSRRWYAGLRFDWSQYPGQLAAGHHGHEHEHAHRYASNDFTWALSPYLTFWQSEFVRLRAQYSYTDRHLKYQRDDSDHALWLQCTFTLGPHKAHPF